MLFMQNFSKKSDVSKKPAQILFVLYPLISSMHIQYKQSDILYMLADNNVVFYFI